MNIPARIHHVLVLAGLCPAWLAGCATQQPAPKGVEAKPGIPWWVAPPSAPLPEGFPKPGPVDEVIVKQYPAYRAAVADRDVAQGGRSTSDGLFYPLFNHIESHHIAMSSPVEMTYQQPATSQPDVKVPSLESMAFIYTSPTVGEAGKDGPVRVVDVPATTVASVGVIGSYDEQHFLAGKAKLDAWLAAHASEYAAAGKPRHLAYNSPFVLPFMRYSEVQIPVVPVKK